MKTLILGAGISGKSANKLLKKLGNSTFVLDDNKKLILSPLKDRLFSDLSLIVVSPGVSLDHEVIVEAKKRGIEVIGELELGCRYLSCPYIAITGTNGKTTTTTLTSQLIKHKKVFTGGNIGVPVCSFALASTEKDIAVLEVSSFQLESIKKFKPHIAVFLNFTIDHLNRHKTMENYFNAKKRIFENQDESDFAVINADDEYLMTALTDLKAQKYYFSTSKKVKGCYALDKKAYFFDGEKEYFLFDTSLFPLKGEHNLSNCLASVLCAILAKEDLASIKENIHNLKGVSHRLEYIAEINGVTYINDSKSTNISSCIVALKAMSEPTTVILGGSDKGFEFDELFESVPANIKNFIVLGQTKQKILSSSKKYKISNVFEAQTLKEAVYMASALSKKGETVLLSPACASFDMFKDYEMRGRVFSKIVRELEKHENRKVSSKKRKKI